MSAHAFILHFFELTLVATCISSVAKPVANIFKVGYNCRRSSSDLGSKKVYT